MCSRGRWRIVARSNEQLARILDVSATAVAKAEESGRIAREPGGEWSVLDVVRQWRDGVHQYLQRDPPPWIDPQCEPDWNMLTRKARYAGARVEVQCEGDDAWLEIPDPVQRVNRGESFDVDDSIVDWLSVGELNALAPGAGYWLSVPEITAPIVAKLTGVSRKKAQDALDGAVRVALLWQIAAAEDEGLGPAHATSLRHGRIALTALARPQTAGEAAWAALRLSRVVNRFERPLAIRPERGVRAEPIKVAARPFDRVADVEHELGDAQHELVVAWHFPSRPCLNPTTRRKRLDGEVVGVRCMDVAPCDDAPVIFDRRPRRGEVDQLVAEHPLKNARLLIGVAHEVHEVAPRVPGGWCITPGRTSDERSKQVDRRHRVEDRRKRCVWLGVDAVPHVCMKGVHTIADESCRASQQSGVIAQAARHGTTVYRADASNAAGGSPRRGRGAISVRSEDGGGIGDHHAGPPPAPAFPRRVSGCPRCSIGRA